MEAPEKLIRLADVPALSWLPTRAGRPIHLATVYRWVKRGINGRRLRVVQVGAGMATSETWLLEFFTPHGAPAERRTTTQRQRAIDQAERELAAAGI